MDLSASIDQLKRNKEAIVHLSSNVSQEQATWRPGDDRWTIVETINHLVDIERDDFGFEFHMILASPDESWPNFSIEKWRVERKYNERSLEESVERFVIERDSAVERLAKLRSPDLDSLHSGKGFRGEPMRAGDVLLSWIAHDFFHIRQLSLLRWDILNEWGKPYSPKYSGFST